MYAARNDEVPQSTPINAWFEVNVLVSKNLFNDVYRTKA
jgi:hypothetical protein